MISDVLCEAEEQIRRYLREMPDTYTADRPAIERLLTEIDHVRHLLDAPPPKGLSDHNFEAIYKRHAHMLKDAILNDDADCIATVERFRNELVAAGATKEQLERFAAALKQRLIKCVMKGAPRPPQEASSLNQGLDVPSRSAQSSPIEGAPACSQSLSQPAIDRRARR